MAERFRLNIIQARGTRSGRATLLATWIFALGCGIALVLGFPSEALAATPHAGGTALSTCSSCHSPHRASTAGSLLLHTGGPPGEVSLCLTCHDGSGAASNVKSGQDGFALASGHVLESQDGTAPADLTSVCSSCHTAHGDSATQPGLPAASINSVVINGAGKDWCLSCHNDGQDWYAGLGTYPPPATPTRDASGYPIAGVFAGASVYSSPTANAHEGIPASDDQTRTQGDCLYCHNAHGSTSKYDSLSATLAPSSAASVASDRATGEYAALCLSCHGGGSWETSGAANIKQHVTDGASDESTSASGGHRIKSPGGTLPVEAPLPCYDCHNPHGSSRGNTKLLSDALGGSLDTSAGPEAVRTFCLSCHVTSDLLGWESVSATYAAVPASAAVEGLLRNGGADGSGPGGEGKNWLLLKETPGHERADASMSCYDCHGSDYGTSGAGNVHAPGLSGVAPLAGEASESATSTVEATGTIAPDSTPPTTTADALSSYIGMAAVTLTATDDADGSGVAYTYYSLDGGTETTGSIVMTSTVGTHTLEFWSVDAAGNVESPRQSVSYDVLASTSETFSFTGSDQFYTVPPGVSALTFDVYGASGGSFGVIPGGDGGLVHAVVSVEPGQILTMRVGSSGSVTATGWPNGGAGDGLYGASGGGSSSVMLGTTILVEAGAGGGAGSTGLPGGDGGYDGWLPGGNETGVSGTAGGGGGWNGGAANSGAPYGSGYGGSSYIAAGAGAVLEGVWYGGGKIAVSYVP